MDQENGKKWEMPEPKFRRSEGEPVTPATGEYFDPEPDTLAPDAPDEPELETKELDIHAVKPAVELRPPEPVATPAPAVPDPLARLYDPPPGGPVPAPKPPPAPAVPTAIAVEPQPYISEQFTAEKVDVKSNVPAAGTTRRPALALLGVIILLAAAAGLAGLVYFLFFAGRVPAPAT